jgi:hypothetical protein
MTMELWGVSAAQTAFAAALKDSATTGGPGVPQT